VITPALLRIGELLQSGDIELDAERLAMVITRRILATIYRYVLGASDPAHQRVLERLDESVQTLAQQLAVREHAVG